VRAGAEIALSLSEVYSEDIELSDVRVGLATGPALEREADYFGPTVNLASRIVNIAFQAGTKATVDFSAMLRKRLTFTATTLRSRSNAEKGAIRDALLQNVWPLIETAKIRPVIDSRFPLAEAQAAHARMAAGQHTGKILLTA